MDGIVRRLRDSRIGASARRLGSSASLRNAGAGFTFVELMIALAIGGIVVAAALALYAHGRSIYRANERIARLQEQGRFALSVIEPDIELAGYYGFTNQA